MTDRATTNLASSDLDKPAAFYQALGFSVGFKDDGWMILSRGDLQLKFFPHADLDPRSSRFSACLRVDHLDALYADFSKSSIPNDCWSTPRMDSPQTTLFGLRMFHLVDLDGSSFAASTIARRPPPNSATVASPSFVEVVIVPSPCRCCFLRPETAIEPELLGEGRLFGEGVADRA